MAFAAIASQRFVPPGCSANAIVVAAVPVVGGKSESLTFGVEKGALEESVRMELATDGG